MASWIMHLAVANEISKKIKVKTDRFNLGNLLPDMCAQNKSAKDKSHFRIEKEPYELSTAAHYQYYDYDRFVEKYKAKMDDDLYLGYLSHLLTDEIWIQKIYIKYMRDENRKKRVDQQVNYYHDYDVLNALIQSKYNLNVTEIVGQMKSITDFEEIEEIELSELPRLLQLLVRYSNNEYKSEKLHLFNECEVREFIDTASSEIVKFIKENMREFYGGDNYEK